MQNQNFPQNENSKKINFENMETTLSKPSVCFDKIEALNFYFCIMKYNSKNNGV